MESIEVVLQVFSVLVAIIIYWGIVKFANKKRSNRAIPLKNTSVLFSYYSEGAIVTNMHSGKLKNKLRYTALLTSDDSTTPGLQQTSLVYKVILPFATTIHLLGIPKNTNATQLNPAINGGVMEKVSLEGTYDKIFDLYAEKGMQTESRYVLDPKAMVFTIDFCQSQNWEIVGNELYFVVTNSMNLDPNDTTQVLDDVIPFIEEIRPAVERPLTASELKMLTPYGEDYRNNLQCPLCSSPMTNEDTYYHCPQGHGVLLSGGQLSQVVSGALKPKLTLVNPQEHAHQLHCPSCKSVMTKVAYNSGNMIIDSCSACAYRWLDAGEYTK